MIVLIAIAIESPGRLSLSPIHAARADVERLYKTLASATGSLFDELRSVCLIDPTASEARSAIIRTASQLHSVDTLVIFLADTAKLQMVASFFHSQMQIPTAEARLAFRNSANG